MNPTKGNVATRTWGRKKKPNGKKQHKEMQIERRKLKGKSESVDKKSICEINIHESEQVGKIKGKGNLNIDVTNNNTNNHSWKQGGFKSIIAEDYQGRGK